MSLLDKYLIVVVGPTAIGKTALAVQLAKHFQTEVVSADSRQLFKEMSIGTAKPTPSEMEGIPHHFVDSHSIHEPYNAGRFERDALDCIAQIHSSKNVAILAGGSGLYVDAVCKGFDDIPERAPQYRKMLEENYALYGLEWLQETLQKVDPEYFAIVDQQNPHRLMRGLEVVHQTGESFLKSRKSDTVARPFKVLKVGLNTNRELLYERINLRVELMVKAGLVEEVKELHPQAQLEPLNTVGYRELFAHFDGEHTLEEAIALIQRNTRRFAKRQLTWFRRDTNTQWFDREQNHAIINWLESAMA